MRGLVLLSFFMFTAVHKICATVLSINELLQDFHVFLSINNSKIHIEAQNALSYLSTAADMRKTLNNNVGINRVVVILIVVI